MTVLTQLVAVEFSFLADPASSYMKRFHDMGKVFQADERFAEWLGAEVAVAAHQDF